MSRTKKHWTLTRKDCLTKEQEARLPVVCAKWREIALSTEPSDRKMAEKAIFEIYRAQGAKEMPKVIWLNNPLDYNERIAKWMSATEPRLYGLDVRTQCRLSWRGALLQGKPGQYGSNHDCTRRAATSAEPPFRVCT